MTARAAVEVLPIYALHRVGPRIVQHCILVYAPPGDADAQAICYSGKMLTEVAIMSNISQLPSSFASYFGSYLYVAEYLVYSQDSQLCHNTPYLLVRCGFGSRVRFSSEPATRSCHRKEASTTSKLEAMNSYY